MWPHRDDRYADDTDESWNRDFVRDPAARALIRRIRGQLDSADAWVVAIRLLPKFPGTLLELAHVAASTAAP